MRRRPHALLSLVDRRAWQAVDQEKVSAPQGEWNAVLQGLINRSRNVYASTLPRLTAESLAALQKLDGLSKEKVREEMKRYLQWEKKADRPQAELFLAAQNGESALHHLRLGQKEQARHETYRMTTHLFHALESDLRTRQKQFHPFRFALEEIGQLFRRPTEFQPSAPPSFYARPEPVPHPTPARTR